MFLRILTACALRSSLGKGNSLPEVWVTSSKNACSAFRKASLSLGKCSHTCVHTYLQEHVQQAFVTDRLSHMLPSKWTLCTNPSNMFV